MIYVDNQNVTDPHLNLALEEHLLRQVCQEQPLLLFYVNEPSVILGRNQNVWEEVDLDYMQAHGIHLVRRLSGGGAVYHDEGNLNFSFITPGGQDLHNFAKFTGPVTAVLHSLGVAAELRNKSSLFVGERKISGNAQYMTAGRMVSHGTLLFDTNLERMLHALNPRRATITSRAVQSVRSRVVNLRDLLPPGMTVPSLKEALLRGIFGGAEPPTYQPTAADWAAAAVLVEERYRAWEWRVARSPHCVITHDVVTPSEPLRARVTVEHGIVQALEVDGLSPAASLAQGVVGVRYERATLAAAIEAVLVDATPDFVPQGVTASLLLDLLYG
ncbi:MAG: lipoate--protein ligase [Anaerolineales bacterium]|nr:lipoate--protein ligase [Anaerolineales bacterium]MCA9976871.1 lipoate--protein ligase [Anaerolineales bacterium]